MQARPQTLFAWRSFNPYRVFKFVATASLVSVPDFSFPVSIPIGFSSSLQRERIFLGREHVIGFNPYRVFKFVATLEYEVYEADGDGFQSLSGFQVRCNRDGWLGT